MGFENLGPTIGTLYRMKDDGTYERVARNVSMSSCPSFDDSEEDDGIDEIVFTPRSLKSGMFTIIYDDIVSEQDAEFVDE